MEQTMSELKEAATVYRKSDLPLMTDSELLEAVRATESLYKTRVNSSAAMDHRRHLSRNELENVFRLVQLRANCRVDSEHDLLRNGR